jgi:DNA-binding SARP family transcriptional activator
VLDIDTDTVGIKIDACIELDVIAFETCLANDACGAEAAIELYQGDLLEGLGHECFAAERERLSDRYEDALAIVAERRLGAGDLVGARAAADRLLGRDPLREEAHAVLIAVHGQIGSRSQVVRQHRRLEDVLQRELGEAPLPDTEAIYRQALDSTMRRALERASEIAPERLPVLVAVGR